MTEFLPLPEEFLDAIAQRVVAYMQEDTKSSCGVVEAEGAWLNTKSAARYLDCPTSRIHDLVALGHLDPERDGQRLLFSREQLDAYVRSHRKAGRRS